VRAHIKRLDQHGNPWYCCRGNLFGVYGSPGRVCGTRTQWADVMGTLWMSGRGLAQAIPPMYGQYVGALILAHLCEVALRKRGWGHLAQQVAELQLWDLSLDHPVWQQVQSKLHAVPQPPTVAASRVGAVGGTQSTTDTSLGLNPAAPPFVPASYHGATPPMLPCNFITSSGYWAPPPPSVSWGAVSTPFSSGASFELCTQGLGTLYYSRWGPLGEQWGGNLLSPGVCRYGPARPDLLEHGLQTRLVYYNPCSTWDVLLHVQQVVASEPSSRWCVVVPLWRGELLQAAKLRLRSLGFGESLEAAALLPDAQRHRDGRDVCLHGSWRVWVRAPPVALLPTATLVDLTPPSKEEVSTTKGAGHQGGGKMGAHHAEPLCV
jgi:hypothetical protein